MEKLSIKEKAIIVIILGAIEKMAIAIKYYSMTL